jgi:hypothetical protein
MRRIKVHHVNDAVALGCTVRVIGPDQWRGADGRADCVGR